ncbi:MAG: hypothetical protein Q7T55_22780 [Solirubrobacteraceae bacterium]|nr:hypothetical protein [Solirubrobacteraceae bacterium]
MQFAGGAYAFFALCCALGAGMIARQRGMSFWIWFSVGLVLPVLGNVAAFLARNENDEARRLCPTCQTVTVAYAAQCMKCGTELEYPSEDAILPSVNELRRMRAAGEV